MYLQWGREVPCWVEVLWEGPAHGLAWKEEVGLNPFQLSDASMGEIEQSFQWKQRLAHRRWGALFSVFEELTDEEEITALKFLYAYMTLTDLADYHGELFLSHVRNALRAREITPWGRKVPGNLFLHFVLPPRISIETLEDYRPYFLEGLLGRTKGMSMGEAILEVNHWAHEKATYEPADPRTASPLTVIRKAKGRCGEESALVVAALRSLCIPARQCYAPRWAHTDSNHAWVEAWADGEWGFLGACEPEPKLNMGWFSGPAQRAMLVHTRVPGRIYDGPEPRVQVCGDFTELNLTSRYAPTRELTVAVKDESGRGVPGAAVEFQVFNFGRFSTLARLTSDHQGEARLSTGRGDLMAFASSPAGWGYSLVKGSEFSAEVVLCSEPPSEGFQFTMAPPPEIPGEEPPVTEAERAANNARLKYEDEVRTAYEATFLREGEARALAEELGFDEGAVVDILGKARGNSGPMAEFLREVGPRYGQWALRILQVLSPKDLTDSTGEILMDHLEYALLEQKGCSGQDFAHYVLCPRISLEPIRAYRAFFRSAFSAKQQGEFRKDPARIARWIRQNIQEVPLRAVRGFPTPRGVYELGIGDIHAKEILFVAMARSFGIPARLDPIGRRPQFRQGGAWVDVRLGRERVEPDGQAQAGVIHLTRQGDAASQLEYYRHFALSRLTNNTFQVLRFRDLDEASFDEVGFSDLLEARPGYYWLTVGLRLPDGSVRGWVQPFYLRPGETRTVPLALQSDALQGDSLGYMGELALHEVSGKAVQVTPDTWAKGMLLAWIEPDREPSKHLLKELGELGEEYESLGCAVVLAVGEERLSSSLAPGAYPTLPQGTVFCLDGSYVGVGLVESALGKTFPRDFPLVFAVNARGEVVYVSTGYRIGMGMQVLQALSQSPV